MAKGTLVADELKVARIDVDLLVNPAKIHVTAALIDNGTGRTTAWTTGDASMWSRETMQKLKELCEAMEEDMAKHILSEHGVSDGKATKAKSRAIGGIGERLGSADGAEPPDAPSV
jgi:hypothetical protein